MQKLLGCLLLAGTAGGFAMAASDDRWIHVRVDSQDGSKGRVDIQVPIGMVLGLLPMLKGAHARGSIRVDDKSIDVAEIREYWTAVKAAKDGDYVTVRDEDSDVRIAKRGGTLLVTVDDNGGRSRVRMKVPLPLIDAVLAGSLADEDSRVRIWIDGSAAPAREDAP